MPSLTRMGNVLQNPTDTETFELLGSYTEALVSELNGAERKTSHRAAVQLLMANRKPSPLPFATSVLSVILGALATESPARGRGAPKIEKCPGVFATARPANRLNGSFPNAPTDDYPRGRRVDASLGAKLETCPQKGPDAEAPGS